MWAMWRFLRTRRVRNTDLVSLLANSVPESVNQRHVVSRAFGGELHSWSANQPMNIHVKVLCLYGLILILVPSASWSHQRLPHLITASALMSKALRFTPVDLQPPAGRLAWLAVSAKLSRSSVPYKGEVAGCQTADAGPLECGLQGNTWSCNGAHQGAPELLHTDEIPPPHIPV